MIRISIPSWINLRRDTRPSTRKGAGAAPIVFTTSFDPAKKAGLAVLTNSNRTLASGGGTNTALAVKGFSAGKRYGEFVVVSGTGAISVGLSRAGGSADYTSAVGGEAGEFGMLSAGGYLFEAIASGSTTAYGATAVIGLARDHTLRNIWWSINGVWQTGDPAAGTGSPITYGGAFGDMFPAVSVAGDSVVTYNPDASQFAYPMPAGFTADNAP